MVAQFGDVLAGIYQTAEHILFLHAAGVMARVAGGRHVSREFDEIRYPSDRIELIFIGQFGADRLDVDGLVFGVQGKHRAVNDAVLLGVESVGRKDVAGLQHALGAYQ